MFFTPLLNYTADVYEAIIAAFIVVGLVQSFALRRKWHQAEQLKANFKKAALAATASIISLALKSSMEGYVARNAVKRANAERDEALRVAEKATTFAEQASAEAVNARADADDAQDELRATQPGSGGGGDYAGFSADGGTFNREPGAPDVPFSFEDLQKAVAGLEAASRHTYEEAARHFGPDSGAVNPDAADKPGSPTTTLNEAAHGFEPHPADAEACDTQRAPERTVPRYGALDR